MYIDYLHIISLIIQYSYLEDGVFVELPTELLCLSEYPEVYISRRSLKHFIERRKKELLKSNSYQNTLTMLISMIFYISKVMCRPDKIVVYFKENKYVYQKIYAYKKELSLRVVLEEVGGHFEIKSIHFIKNNSCFQTEKKNTTSQ